jgi:hypothetical protein
VPRNALPVIGLLVPLLIVQCSERPPNTSTTDYIQAVYSPVGSHLAGEVIVSDLSPAEIQWDGFAVTDMRIAGDYLALTIEYGGGCQEHQFWCYMSPAAFLESYPAQANLYIRHNANDDFCDALLTQQLIWDLSSVCDLYLAQYGSLDPITINVHDYFLGTPGTVHSATYYPELE